MFVENVRRKCQMSPNPKTSPRLLAIFQITARYIPDNDLEHYLDSDLKHNLGRYPELRCCDTMLANILVYREYL